jgi:hypothetical protein
VIICRIVTKSRTLEFLSPQYRGGGTRDGGIEIETKIQGLKHHKDTHSITRTMVGRDVIVSWSTDAGSTVGGW